MKKVVVSLLCLSCLPGLTSVSFAQGAANPISGPADSTDQGLDVEVVKNARPRFYGFGFDFSFFDSTGLNAINYSNSMTMYFEPSWAIGKLAFRRGHALRGLSLGGRFVLTVPLAGYDDGNYRSDSDLGPPQPCSNLVVGPNGVVNTQNANVQRCHVDGGRMRSSIPGDVWLTLAAAKLVTIPKVGISITPTVRVILPSSVESQFTTLYMSLTGQLGASRSFFKDKLTLGYTFGATKFFHKYSTPAYTTNTAINEDPLANNLSYTNRDLSSPFFSSPIGGANPDFGFRHIFAVDVAPTDKLSFSLLYILLNTYSYNLSQNTIQGPDGTPFNVQDSCQRVSAGPCGRGHKDSQVFWFTVAYQVVDWLSLSVAWINYSPLRMPDNSYRQGIVSVDYNAFTQISLGASMSIDKLAAKLF